MTITQGIYNYNKAVFLHNISLPEFMNKRKIKSTTAHLFNSPTYPYNVILGRDFLKTIGLDIQFSNNRIKWLDTIVDMKHIKMYDHLEDRISPVGNKRKESKVKVHL